MHGELYNYTTRLLKTRINKQLATNTEENYDKQRKRKLTAVTLTRGSAITEGQSISGTLHWRSLEMTALNKRI